MIRRSKDGKTEIHATEEVFKAIDREYECSPEEIKRIDSWAGISLNGEMTIEIDQDAFDKMIA